MILCGGAYNSPQLLMLSGVGPAEHLALREIEVLLDQPAVGENLSDHAATYGVWTTPEPESLLLALEPAALEEFTASQTGPFASNLAEAGAFARVEPGAEAPGRPVPRRRRCRSSTRALGDPDAHGVWVSPCLLTPESRGSVRLASNDPTAKPIVRNDFYATESDMERMVAGAAADARRSAPSRRCAPYCAEPLHRARRRLRRRAARARRPHHLRDLPPGRHLRDRLGRRRRPAGRRAWRRSASSTPR